MQGTAGVCLQDEIEMLVSNFQHRAYITVNEQIAWYVGAFFSFGYCLYVENLAQRDAFL